MRCSAAQSIDVTKIKPQRLTRLVSQPTITRNSGGCARVRTRVVNGRRADLQRRLAKLRRCAGSAAPLQITDSGTTVQVQTTLICYLACLIVRGLFHALTAR